MKLFISTFLTGLAVVGLFNFGMNRGETSVKQNWSQDEIFLTPDNFDERIYVISHLKVTPRPDILLLGSSRGMLVDSQMFRENVSFFNAAVSGASVQDYIAIWQFLKDQGKLPAYLIIFIDPWVFNKNNGQMRWESNLDLYEEFHGHDSKKQSPLVGSLNEAKRWALEVADLFTWPVLRHSLLTLYRGVYQTGIIKLSALPPYAQGKRSDGSLVYPADLIETPSLDEVTRRSLQYTTGCIYSLCNWEFDENAYQDLAILLKDANDHGTESFVVLSPYQHVVLKRLLELPDYDNILPEIENTLSKRLVEDSGVFFSFCNALDPVEDGCSETEFMDGMHMLRSCTEKVIQKCHFPFSPSTL